jgi:prepilin-type N-terminal cleavage/methylation domain-containing protein
MDGHDQVLRGRGGFTAVEVLIAATLISILTAAFYSFLFAQATTAFEEGSEQDTQTDMRRTMLAIISELESAKLAYLDTNGAFVRYQVPQVGGSGVILMDNNGNPTFGAFDGLTWYPNVYYELSFLDSARAEDYLVENQLHINLTDSGQNLNQDYVNGSTTTQDYSDAFVFGQFVVQTYAATGNVNSATFRDATGQAGSLRILPGQCLRQYDPNSSSVPKATVPDNGGFFYLRQPQGALLYNAAGLTTGTLVWGPQRSETFTDTNGDGVWESTEGFNDANNNGMYEEADSEAFIDTDGNNVLSGNERYTDANGNGRYDAKLRVQLRVFDARRIGSRSDDSRMLYSRIRMLQTKIKIRNGGQ